MVFQIIKILLMWWVLTGFWVFMKQRQDCSRSIGESRNLTKPWRVSWIWMGRTGRKGFSLKWEKQEKRSHILGMFSKILEGSRVQKIVSPMPHTETKPCFPAGLHPQAAARRGLSPSGLLSKNSGAHGARRWDLNKPRPGLFLCCPTQPPELQPIRGL